MNITGKITVNMKPVNQIMKRLGVDAGGAVQQFHTANVIRRIQKYMPYRSGALIKLMIAQSPISEPFVRVEAPQARYLYHGKAMEGKAPKTVTDRDLKYTTTKNPQAGPFWDRRLKAAEGKAMQSDLQAYVERLGGG
jgi:hypothetical protein